MSTRPISHFGQVLNSVKKQPSSATPNHRQRSTPTNWPLQGKLIFKKPDLPRLPSSPIVIDDESMPVQETADSWERDEFFLSDHGARDPYDETYRPIQQDLVEDSEDETMEHTMRKTRHQPQRMASTRKPEARDQAILSPTAMGMWTPPDSNTRARRTGERVNGGGGTSTKGKEKAQTPATSDPVNIPVLGDPTTKSSSSVTPLGRTRTEMYVALSPLTENTSAARHSRTTSLAASTSGKGSREGAEQVRPWLSKRTAETKPTQKRSVQTKMTTFVSEGSSVPFSSTHHLNTTRGGHGDVHMVSAPSHDFMDDDVFEQQSVCFVKRKINAPADEMSTSARSKQHAPSGIPKPARPLPQRKKRKSGELSTSSDEAIQAEVQTTSSDTVGQSREDLTSRLKAHKRFKFQNHQQENARKLLSDDRMDATSSLTSLSKEPSSEVDDVAGQEVVKSGLKVVKGRPGRAMNVLYSSDVEQDLPVQEDAVAAGVHEEELPFQQTLSTTQSSIVPDSQPWYHMLLPDLNKSHGIDKEPQEQNDRSSNMILRKDQTTAQEPLSNTQPEDHAIPGPSVPVTLERQEAYDTGDGRSTNGMGSFRRPLMQEESRTFPFDFSLQSHLAVVDGTPTESSGGSISSLSQPTHKTPDKGTKIQLREKYRLLVPSLMDEGFEDALAGKPESVAAFAAMLPKHTESHSAQDGPASQYSETLDFHKVMRKMLPPPERATGQLGELMGQSDPTLSPQESKHECEHKLSKETAFCAHVLPQPSSRSKANRFQSIQHLAVERVLDPELNAKQGTEATSPEEHTSRETETMLPLSLDTQLHRPGILSPNFKLRIKQPRNDPVNLQTNVKEPITPKKRQRFASQLITPGKGQDPQPAVPQGNRTPLQQLIPNPHYQSPESMVENVETLATWSPAKYETMRSVNAVQELSEPSHEEKENHPSQSRPIETANSQNNQSLDEVIDGTYGHIQSFHLLETYHRGYTPRKEPAVTAIENALPRTVKRLHPLIVPKPAFAEVNEAWNGVGSEATTSKASSAHKTALKKADISEQSKLAVYGFLKNANVRKSHPVDFDRDFEDEDDLATDDDDDPEPAFERDNSSPTPRKAPLGKVLSTVPVPPIDPRLKPAGIREFQRLERLRENQEEELKKHSRRRDDDQPDKTGDAIPASIEKPDEDEPVPSSQPFENQDVLLNSDSTTDMQRQAHDQRFQGWMEEYFSS